MNIADIPVLGVVYGLHIGEYHYTGSTTDTIHNRYRSHLSAFKCDEKKDRKLFKHISDNGGWEAVKVSILEKDILEANLTAKENSYTNISDPFCLNSYQPIAPLVPVAPNKPRSEGRKAYDKTYYEQRKEELKTRRMERYAEDMKDPEKREQHRKACAEANARLKERRKTRQKKSLNP